MPETKPSEEKGSVGVDWTQKDYTAARLLFIEGSIGMEEFLDLPQMQISKITRRKILQFCQGCDRLGSNGVCTLGLKDQARYVAREYCGWASEDGVRGQMTDEGFNPS